MRLMAAPDAPTLTGAALCCVYAVQTHPHDNYSIAHKPADFMTTWTDWLSFAVIAAAALIISAAVGVLIVGAM